MMLQQQQQQQQQIRMNRPSRTDDASKIFVGGIHVQVDEAQLEAYFGQFDQVVECILMRDRETGHSRGFGFVTFATTDGVARAMAAGSNLSLAGKRVSLCSLVPLSIIWRTD